MADYRDIVRALRGHGERLAAPLEPLATMGTGLAGAGAGGLAGIVDLLRGRGPEKAAQTAQNVQGALTYAPRTQGGREITGDVLRGMERAGKAVTDVAPVLSGQVRGEEVLKRTGSPALATLADMVSPTDAIPVGKLAPAMFLGMGAARRAMAKGDVVPAQMFQIAESMEAAGKTPEQVWAATSEHARRNNAPYAGIVRGVDGKPRIEISDAAAEVQPEGADILADALRHDQLYALDPEMARLPFERAQMERGTRGSYSPRTGTVRLSEAVTDPARQRRVVLHETMHGAQDQARFAGGTSPGRMRERGLGGIEEYRAVPAEAEARLVERRSRLPVEALRQNFPYTQGQYGFDVPLERQREIANALRRR